MTIRALIICSITDSASSKPDIELVIGLHRQGVELDVMIPAHSAYVTIFNKLGIRVYPDHPLKKLALRSIILIRKEIKQRKYGIIHLFNTKAVVNGSLAAIGLPVKVIAYRGAAGIYWYDPTAWLSHLNPRIDLLISNSRYVQQHMQQQLLFRPQKAVMIHKGMDVAWFKNIKPVPRKDLGIPDRAIIVGCVANVRRIKGVPYLIEATYHLNPELPVHILLIGSGMGSESNLRLIESSPFKERIHIVGFRNDVYEVIAACDIYIQPSLSESLSRSVMEAMCLGVPSIVSDIGGLIELVEHEKSGLVVKSGDPIAIAGAIEQLTNNPDLRKALAGDATKRMKEFFSMDNMVTNTRKLYEKILS
jgi:glycosyltransferase involved in cell wall biosynthesis